MKQVDNFIRNPLGIIALFLSVIYGIAGYVISNGFSYLHGCCERIGKFFPRRFYSAKHGEGFDAPPTYGKHVAVELTEGNHRQGLCSWFRRPFRNSRLPIQV